MIAVIMAGGSGTRFWPASRSSKPKQFLRIAGERTMLEETAARVRPLVDDGGIYVVVGAAHERLTRELFGGTEVRVIVEPHARNTAACIGLAACHALARGDDEPMAVLPADHFVASPDDFADTLRAAGLLAAGGAIVTLGVPPTRPETGYGYLELGEEEGEAAGRPVRRVARFVEKPDAKTALGYVTGGRHRWNSGVFVLKPSVALREIRELLPALGAGLGRIAAAVGTEREAAEVEEVYRGLESVSIDHGVMERTSSRVVALDAGFGWSDVGSWEALYELRSGEADGEGNLAVGDVAAVDARRNLVVSETGRLVALLGVEGLVVVDTPDAVLVADARRSQDVKKLPELLANRGRRELC